MKYEGVFMRAVATIIDTIILSVFSGIWNIIFGKAVIENGKAITKLPGIPALIGFLIWILYYVVMEAKFGATVGKMVCNLRIVKENGDPIGFKESVIRTLLRLIDFIIFYLLAAILVGSTEKKQRLGDLAAKTVVIRVEK